MEYSELSAYPVPGGDVVVWVPDAAPGTWTPDHRGLSFNHEVHVRSSSRGSWIGGVMRMPHDMHRPALRRALEAWIARHEALRSSIVADEGHPQPSGTGWSRMAVAAEHVRVRDERIGRFTAQEAGPALEGFFAMLVPTTWPHVVFATVVDEQPGFVLAFGADHSVMDAYSQLLWFAEIEELYRWALDAPADADPPELSVGSYVSFSVTDREQGSAMEADHPIVRAWRSYLAGDGPADDTPAARWDADRPLRYPGYPDSRVTSDQDPPGQQRSVSRWLAGATGSETFFDTAKEHGVSGQSAVLGALAEAMRRSCGARELRAVLPVHTRVDPSHRVAVGWFVGLSPLSVQVGEADLLTLMHRCHLEARRVCGLAPQATRAAQLLGVAPGAPFVVSYVDLRHISGSPQWEAWQARTLRSRTHSNTDLYLWILRTRQGLNISTRYPDSAGAHEAVTELLDTLTDVVAQAPALLDPPAGAGQAAPPRGEQVRA